MVCTKNKRSSGVGWWCWWGVASLSGSVSETEIIHLLRSPSVKNNISHLIGFKVCLGGEEELRLMEGFRQERLTLLSTQLHVI